MRISQACKDLGVGWGEGEQAEGTASEKGTNTVNDQKGGHIRRQREEEKLRGLEKWAGIRFLGT